MLIFGDIVGSFCSLSSRSSMKDIVRNHLSGSGLLQAEEIDTILDNIHIYSYKKGEVLLKENQSAKACYVVLEGCVRQYQTIDGEEKIIAFFLEGDPVIAYESYLDNKPSSYAYACVENSVVLAGTKEQERNILEKHPRLDSLTQVFVQQDYTKMQARLASFVNHNPEERYQHLMKQEPELLNRIPLQYLASYMGITPESFSRIRKRIHMKEKEARK